MIETGESRTCTATGLRLLPALGEISYRVAKDRYGALAVRTNEIVGPRAVGTASTQEDARGRYDSLGSTVYLADSRRCAYSEVLTSFRQSKAAITKVAASIGWDPREYLASVIKQANTNGIDAPWAISLDWQMDRSLYEIRLPRKGWWVQIDHPDSFKALEHLNVSATDGAEKLQLLTNGSITGEDRDLTTLIAHAVRTQTLDDGSEPLGINYSSKTLQGRCWAYWDRRTDLLLPPGRNDLIQLTSENVGPDPEFISTAEYYSLPILNGRKL